MRDIIFLVRTFIAIEPPGELKEQIGEFGKKIEKLFPLRLVAPQNLHLTLFFLGEIGEAGLASAIEAVKMGIEGIKPFYLLLGRPEFFPKAGRVNGLWLNLEGQIDVLEKLHRQIAEELKNKGFKLEGRPFVPHITIGRSKKKIKRVNKLPSITGEFRVDSVSVFTSQLSPKGPFYSKIESVELK